MNTTLVRRSHRPPPLLTKELRKRSRLSAWALYKVYAPIVNLVAFTLALAGLIVGAALTGWNDAWFCLMIGATSCCLLWSIGWIIGAGESGGVDNFTTRRLYVSLDELRKTRAHRGDEIARLPDLDHAYSRYSIQVQRDKQAIVLVAVKHDYRGGLLVRWRASATQSMYDASRGEWGARATADWKISQPTLDKVMERLTDAQVVVEELENNAYADALKKHQLDVLALAVQPPPASAFSRARVAVGEDVLDDLSPIILQDEDGTA